MLRGQYFNTVVLRSAYHNTFIQHAYNTPIQHTNRKIKRKRKLDFVEVIKGGTYIRIGLTFILYSLTRQKR